MRLSRLALVVVAIVLLAASTAAASGARGVAPLGVPDAEGHLRISPNHHLSFRLPPGRWKAATNDQGEPVSGMYVRVADVGGSSCVVNLGVDGRGYRARPTLRTIGRSDHIRRGTTASGVHWLSAWDQLPPTPPHPYARAYRRAPKPAAFRWAFFEVIPGLQEPATAACRATVRRLDLAAVARSFRVEPGRAPIGTRP